MCWNEGADVGVRRLFSFAQERSAMDRGAWYLNRALDAVGCTFFRRLKCPR